MKKVFAILVSLVIILLILCSIPYFFSNVILSRLLTNQMGTPVSIQKVVYKYPSILFQKLIVSNIPKSRHPVALFINKIDINTPYGNYFKHVIEIDEVVISDAVLTVEFFGRKGNENNWSLMMDSMDSGTNSPDDRYAIIKEFKVRNLKVIVIKDGQITEKVIPEITLQNVQTKNGALVKELTKAIIFQMIFNIENIINIPLKALDLLNQTPNVPSLPFGR